MRSKNKRCRERIQKGGLETKLATLLNNKPRNERWLKKSMGLVHLLLVELTSSDWCSTFGSLAVPVMSFGIFKKNETEEYTEPGVAILRGGDVAGRQPEGGRQAGRQVDPPPLPYHLAKIAIFDFLVLVYPLFLGGMWRAGSPRGPRGYSYTPNSEGDGNV